MNLFDREVGERNSPTAKVAKMAESLAKERNIPYRQAVIELGREYPGLMRRAREAVLGVEVYAERQPAPSSFDETVGEDRSPTAKVARMAETLAKERNIPYRQAVIELGRTHPDLMRRARASVLGREV